MIQSTRVRNPVRYGAGLAFLLPMLTLLAAPGRAEGARPSCLSASPSQFDFGEVRVGNRGVRDVTLYNACGHRVSVNSITGNPDAFGSDAPTPIQIPARSFHSLQLRFAPSAPGVLAGTVSLALRNDPAGKLVLAVQGVAMSPPAISVSPGSLEATVAAGASTTLILDVTNSGTERLEAIVDAKGPALPRPAAGWRVLYLNTVIPGQDGDDFTRALSARPGLDSVVAFDGTAGSPALAQLLAYDVVMVNGASAWADPDAVAAVLREYLHAGGKLAILAGAMASGPGVLYYDIASYFTFHAGMPLSTGGQAASFETHPINEGVGAFSSAAVVPSSSIGGIGMGSPLGYYDNGHLIGAYAPFMPVVCLNIHPVDGGWGGDLTTLVGNTFDYLGGMMNWLTYTKPWPNDFVLVVNGNSTRALELKVHANRLAPGTYQGQVELDHSDPVAPNPLIVPVTLTVTP